MILLVNVINQWFTGAMAQVGIRPAVGSDTGRQRDANEDSAYISRRLLAVADGMGGHAHGEVASAAAIAAFADLDNSLDDAGATDTPGATDAAETAEQAPETDVRATLAGAVADACQRLAELAQQDPSLHGMGTTLTAMLWDGASFALAHVGDTRGYLLRDGELTQLTRDHTMVQSLVDEGRMLPEQAIGHPRRSVLTRALQTSGSTEPDLSVHEALPGDRYLLCSDGLTDAVPPELLGEVLNATGEPDDMVRMLIELANEGGGPDNITCVVADVVASPTPEIGAQLAGAAARVDGTA